MALRPPRALSKNENWYFSAIAVSHGHRPLDGHLSEVPYWACEDMLPNVWNRNLLFGWRFCNLVIHKVTFLFGHKSLILTGSMSSLIHSGNQMNLREISRWDILCFTMCKRIKQINLVILVVWNMGVLNSKKGQNFGF